MPVLKSAGSFNCSRRVALRSSRRFVGACSASTDAAKKVEAGTSDTGSLRSLEDLPVETGIPVMGMALDYLTPEFEMMPLFDKHGDHFMINLGPAGGLSLAIRNESEVQQVLSTEAVFRSSWPDSMTRLTSEGASFSSKVSLEEGRPFRKSVQRALSHEAVMAVQLPLMLESFQHLIHEKAQQCEETGEEILWRPEAKRMALGVVARTMLGDRFTEEELAELLPQESAISDGLFALDFGFKEGLPLTKYWRAMNARKWVLNFSKSKLTDILEDRGALEASDTMLSRLMTSMREEGVFTDDTPIEDIAEQLSLEVLSLMFAGTDTTAYGLTRAAVWLAQHPEWHQALWEEQKRLMEEFGPDIDRKVLSRSAVAAAMVQESHRVRPAIKVSHRTAVEDTTVGDLAVPAGTPLAICVAASGIRTGNGSPYFEPEQWLSEDRTKFTANGEPGMVPFSTGPRTCPGRNLATVEMILNFILLARETQEIRMSEEELKVAFIAVNHPTGCRLKLVPRKND